MHSHKAFTLLELVFVIVVMGILGKFGVEFLSEAYKNFIYSNINNTLQSNSATAVEFISTRLQHRIKDSIIARKADGSFKPLISADYNNTATILEWIGSDIDGYRGTTLPYWSSIIDIDNANANATTLISPETNTTAVDNLIKELSNGNSDINDSALFFIGSNIDINGFGWDGTAITTQDMVMHPIHSVVGIVDRFVPVRGDNGVANSFTGVDVYEYYKLAWSAYAVVHEADNLTLYYDYQPWQGEKYTDGKSATIMQNVSTFRFRAIGSVVKIQVCVKSNLTNEEYSICKEKTIF